MSIDLHDVIATQHPRQAVADHEVLLSFASDEQATIFWDWLYAHWADFQEYEVANHGG